MKPLWYWVIACFLTIVAVFGNGLVIYLITTRPRLHTTSNSFVLSLAVIDCIVGLLYFPVYYACDGSTWCDRRVYGTFVAFLILTSVANLCVMTLDRYVAIVKPLNYVHLMRTRRVFILIFAAWVFPLLFHLLPKMLLLLKGEKDLLNKSMSSFQFLFQFAACVFMIFATGRIFLIVRKHSRQVAALNNQLRLNAREDENREARARINEAYSAKVIITLVAIFVLCFSIAQYYNLQNLIVPLPELPPSLRLCLRLLFVTNSATNPLVYAFLKKDMKAEARRFFRGRTAERLANETSRAEMQETAKTVGSP